MEPRSQPINTGWNLPTPGLHINTLSKPSYLAHVVAAFSSLNVVRSAIRNRDAWAADLAGPSDCHHHIRYRSIPKDVDIGATQASRGRQLMYSLRTTGSLVPPTSRNQACFLATHVLDERHIEDLA